ncbi:hypothetical protein BDB01DRAFT_850148 [Pilobolus umbonatus]|nr:hypothetical protein BDB01DRAFT_850148 [Pilobolus umbonatus]
MPGFRIEEPFSLVRFQHSINRNDSKNCIIGLDCSDLSANEEQDVMDQVAITVQGEGLKLYNTTDQKCIKSWTTPPGISFVRPAIYCDGGRDFNAYDYTYAIIASGTDINKTEQGKVVWVWKSRKNSDNDDHDKIVKTFAEPINAIYTSPVLHSNVVIVHDSGSIGLTTKDLDRITANQKPLKDSMIVWSTLFVTSSGNTRHSFIPSSMVPPSSTVVTTVCNMPKSDIYSIKFNYVNIERRSIDLIASVDLKLAVDPIAFTLDSVAGRLTMLDSSGNWKVYRIQLKHSSSKKINCTLVEDLSIQLDGYNFYDTQLGAVASITSLSDGYVAMIAPRKPSVKNGNVYEHVISVWDMKYGTLQAEQTINMDKNLFNKESCICNIVALPNSHLAITVSSVEASRSQEKGGKKLMEVHSSVMLCPYYSEPVSLLAAIGKMKATVDFIGINDNITSPKTIGYSRSGQESCPPIEYSSKLNYATWNKKLSSNQSLETDLLSKLMNKDIKESEFIKDFFDYLQVSWTPIDMSMTSDIEGKTMVYDKVVKSDHKQNNTSVVLSEFFIFNVVSLCFQKIESTVWGMDIILYLLSKSLVRSKYTEKGIISSLLDKNEWALIPIVLERVQDIPESELVILMKSLIRLYTEDREEWSGRYDSYMKMIITTPRNDIFLQQSLKRITASELPVLLNTLINWYNNRLIDLSIQSTVVDFINAILDIHFTTLILEPGLHNIVSELRALAASQIEETDDLEQLKDILGAYNRKCKHNLAKKILAKEKKAEAQDNPGDELTKFRKKNKGKFGGEQGIPIYRVEVFRF